jgi:trigger factor
VKSAVETLNPTRIRLTVEVPFAELTPSLDAAYKKIAGQVKVAGFRPGKVPPRIIDQRFGRASVLEEAVNDALPRFYGEALTEHSVQPLGRPDVDVTGFADGDQLTFTAEVDVRPEFELPDYRGLDVIVADAEVEDDDVAGQLVGLQERFGTLVAVERAAAVDDFVSIDLSASIDGEELPDGTAAGMSYQVGSGRLLDGLDEALIGLTATESKTFTSALVGGEHSGKQADVTVTVGSVKERELPPLDDDFAQLASEFDTLAELEADLRERLSQMKKIEQGVEARDKALAALLSMVEVPLPENLIAAELAYRRSALDEQLSSAGLTMAEYLSTEGQTQEQFDTDLETRTREGVVAQFVLEAVATKEQLSVTNAELTDHLVRRAARAGISPDQYVQQVMSQGSAPTMVSEVVRGKALSLVLESAVIVDLSGRPVDLQALADDVPGEVADESVAE